jgi:hypothetical protein
VLREVRVALRAEKTSITGVVKDAFTKPKAARSSLNDLEDLMKKDA